MQNSYFKIYLPFLIILLISCQPSLDDKLDKSNYKEDLKTITFEYETNSIFIERGKRYISPQEYDEMISFLSDPDTLDYYKDWKYFTILARIKYFKRNQQRIEEEKRIKELERIAFMNDSAKFYFRDTYENIKSMLIKNINTSKIKYKNEANYATIYIDEYPSSYMDSRIDFSKGYCDDRLRLDSFTMKVNIHRASSIDDYYVGITKYGFEYITDYLKSTYNFASPNYPALSDFQIGYGDKIEVAEWYMGKTFIFIDLHTQKELWDKYGGSSYETKYIVYMTISNNDENLTYIE